MANVQEFRDFLAHFFWLKLEMIVIKGVTNQVRLNCVGHWIIRALYGVRPWGSRPTCPLSNPHFCIIMVFPES